MKNKLALKLIIVIVVSITLIVCVMAPIYFYLQPKMYIEKEKQEIAEFSDSFKEVEPFDKDHLSSFVSEKAASYRIYVFDKDFNPIYTTYEFGNNKKFITKLFENKMHTFTENSEPYYTDVDNDPSVRLSTCCEKNGTTYYIYIKDSHSGVSLVFDFSNKILSYVVIGYIVICSIVLYLAISPSVKSVRKLTKVAKNISDNNLSVRYQGKIRKNEIGDLAQSVNKMADTIQENINNLENYNFILHEDNRYMKEYEESRKMLLRNITHDLKTPLAVISSQVEMIATCKEKEKKDYYFNSAMEEIDKMSKMISSVLQLTVDERRMISKKAEHIDLSELITKLCDSHSAYINAHTLAISKKIEPDLNINTIKDYVEFVFKNYISNAVQNAEDNTTIIVTLKNIQKGVRLSVENIGKHIDEQMKEIIWSESFTTAPQGKENTGLGLYIVKEISLITHTNCGFDNTENGVIFWFDFINHPDEID